MLPLLNRVMVYSPSLGDPTNIKYSISSQKTRFSGIMGPKNEKIEKKKKHKIELWILGRKQNHEAHS
ncbi:hypothetical protein EO92_15330 [Methanosarcina sp. 2.H.A.1B.4]|nr:hypothetical protein EO92_15330 [Methanosarcina sp. 2.H.A.1B.4]